MWEFLGQNGFGLIFIGFLFLSYCFKSAKLDIYKSKNKRLKDELLDTISRIDSLENDVKKLNGTFEETLELATKQQLVDELSKRPGPVMLIAMTSPKDVHVWSNISNSEQANIFTFAAKKFFKQIKLNYE